MTVGELYDIFKRLEEIEHIEYHPNCRREQEDRKYIKELHDEKCALRCIVVKPEEED